jgi:hypothetical protein
MTKRSPFRYFKTSSEINRLAVMMYVRFPLSFRNVEDLLHERGIDISYETVRFWWNRFGPLFASLFLQRLVRIYLTPPCQVIWSKAVSMQWDFQNRSAANERGCKRHGS